MNPEHVEIVRKGAQSITNWRNDMDEIRLDQQGADLNGVDLQTANLSYANLSGAKLSAAVLRDTDLTSAWLSGTILSNSDLARSNLRDADLCWADLRGTCLCGADLRGANLHAADLREADLSEADLRWTRLSLAQMSNAIFHCTTLGNIDFSEVLGLDEILHQGPSTVGTDALALSAGRIPTKFLLNCGLPRWLIEAQVLFDPVLTPSQGAEILSTTVFTRRFEGPLFFGGAFISYAHEDDQHADRIHRDLLNQGMPTWLDKHDAIAGPLAKMVTDAVRSRDVVILILSQHSLQSDWVWHEVATAREKEKQESRYILCPITLDDAWQNPSAYGPAVQHAVERHQVQLGYLKDSNILPFHKPHTFKSQFDKLIRGIIHYYGRPAPPTGSA